MGTKLGMFKGGFLLGCRKVNKFEKEEDDESMNNHC